MVLGAVLGLAGSLLLLTLDADSSLFHLAVPCFVMGLGFGFAVAPSVIAAQSAVAWESRAVTTGVTMFARTVGSAIGVAVFGAMVNARVDGSDRPRRARTSSTCPRRSSSPRSAPCSWAPRSSPSSLVAVSLLMPRTIEQEPSGQGPSAAA